MADDEQKEIGKLYAELHPSSREEHLKSYPATAPPGDGEARQIHELYGELFPLKETGKMPDDDKKITPEMVAAAQAATVNIRNEIQNLKSNPSLNQPHLDNAIAELNASTTIDGYDVKGHEAKQEKTRQDADTRYEANKTAGIDKMAAKADRSDTVAEGAADKPLSSMDATEVDRAREAGQNLNKQHVTMDKE